MTNEELVSRINAGIDTGENMLALYNQMKGAIYQIARKHSGLAELDDLAQEGYIGLCYAVGHYNAMAGMSFLSYAWKCIQGHMVRYIQKDRCLSIHLQERLQQYKKLCNAFLQEHGRKPTDSEIARHLGLSPGQVERLKKGLYMERMASLDNPIGEEGELSLGDTIPSGTDIEQETIDRVEQELLKDTLWGAVDELPDRQPEVIRKRYQRK